MTHRRHKKRHANPVFKNLAAFQAQSASPPVADFLSGGPLQQPAQLAHMFVGAAVPFTRDEPEDPCKEDHVTIYCIICGLTHEVDRCQRPDKMIVGGKIVHLHQTSSVDRLVCQFCGLPVIDWKPMQPCPNRDADGDAIPLPAPEAGIITGTSSPRTSCSDCANAERMVQIARDERRKALVARDEDRKQWERERDEFAKINDKLKHDWAQVNTQLAGCLVAAECGTTGPNDAMRGMYGWSPAFEAVKTLWRKYDGSQLEVRSLEKRISLLEDLLVTKTTPTPIRDAMRTIGQAHLHVLGFMIAMLGIVVWTVRTTASVAAQKAASGIKGWLTRRSPWTVFGAMCFLATVCAWPVHESRFARADFGQSDYSIPTRMLPSWHAIKLPSNFNGNMIYVYGPDELQVTWDQPTMTWSETLVQGDETYRFWRNNCGELKPIVAGSCSVAGPCFMIRGPDGVEHEANLAPVTSKTYR